MTWLEPAVFNHPVTEFRRGYRSAVYFDRMGKVLRKHKPTQEVVMQVFQKNHAVLCGVSEAVAVLKTSIGHYKDRNQAEYVFDEYMKHKRAASAATMHTVKANHLRDMVYCEQELDDLWVNTWNNFEVRALEDGDWIVPWEPVLEIRGPLCDVAHLESVYLGVLARGTKVATNVAAVVEAANGKPILMFADRFDNFATQGADGYAAHIGGAESVATDAMGNWWGDRGVGTMPHALIAAFGGDTVAATAAFKDTIPDTKLIALVDFNNDCVTDSLLCAEEFGDDLYGVRLDTSENMVDRSIADLWQPEMFELNVEAFNYAPRYEPGDFKPTGVNAALVHNVRDALDSNGYHHVKIVVSGGFNPTKIRQFEDDNVPADVYAVGSSLLQGSNDFTADVVEPTAKAGRWLRENPHLKKVS